MSENHGLLKRFGTAEVLGIFSSAMSFKMEVNKDMGSSASAMADWCRRVPHRCWNSSQFAFASFHIWTLSRQGGPSFSSKMGKWSLPQGSGPTFQEKSRKRDRLQRVKSMEVKVPLAEWKYVWLLSLNKIKSFLIIKSSNCWPLLFTSSHPHKVWCPLKSPIRIKGDGSWSMTSWRSLGLKLKLLRGGK